MRNKIRVLTSLAIAVTTASVYVTTHATEITAHRTYVGQFEFGASGFLHPNKSVLTPADQGINPHRHQGTISIKGLGDGYENLIEKCEGVRLRNFFIGAKPPNNHLDVGECTIFQGDERIGTLTYNGPPETGRKLYLESHICEQTGQKPVEGENKNTFEATLAPPEKSFLGGTYRTEIIANFTCTAK